MIRSVRYLGSSAHLKQSVPSSPSMKSATSWRKNSSPASIASIAKDFTSTNSPPLDISSRFERRFPLTESYTPFDFSPLKQKMEQRAQKKAYKLRTDPFAHSGIDPQTLYSMPEILSNFITSSGQILPRSETGCSAKNQKRLANAIKTARACGLLSTVHKHHRYLPSRNI